jgi:HEAT repeat protein
MLRMTLTIVLLLCCFGCGTSRFAASNYDEMQRTFRSKDSASLVRMLATSLDAPQDIPDGETPYLAICEILLERRQTEFLVNAYRQSSNESVRGYLATRGLYQIDEPSVLELFRSRLSEKEDEEACYITIYVAETGDTKALEILNRHYFQYPVSSWQWADTVELFGKFGYRPAIPNLVDSLNAASLNLACAACASLKQLYLDAPRELSGPTSAREYFSKRAGEERKRESETLSVMEY